MTWIHTWSGRKFDLLAPNPDDVCLEDIAWSLAAIQRYTGHGRIPCSVAEHSCRVAMALRFDDALTRQNLRWLGLCHDAHEAYIGDWSSPLKRATEACANEGSKFENGTVAFKEIERRVWDAVESRLGLEQMWRSIDAGRRVRAADLADLALEAPSVLPWPPPVPWGGMLAPGVGEVGGWSRERAAEEWLTLARAFAPTVELRNEASHALDRLKATHGSYHDKHQSFEQALVAMRPWHCSEKRMAEMPCTSCLPYFNALESIRNERAEHLQRIRTLQEQLDDREGSE